MAMLVGARGVLLSALLVSVFLLSSSPALATTAVEYCDKKADYAVKVKGVEISPDPVARGKPATFSISAHTGDAISTGKLVIDVKYLGIHIHEETHDLCKKTSCPISTGDFVVSHRQSLPFFTPPGSYTLMLKMLGKDGNQLTCVTFGFSMGFISPVADI